MAVIGVVFVGRSKPLRVAAVEPIAQRIQAAVTTTIVIVTAKLQLASLKRWFHGARPMRVAHFDQSSSALPDLPADNLIKGDHPAPANRSIDQIAQAPNYLLGDWQSHTLKVVERLAPVALGVISQDHEASRAARSALP